MQKVPYRKVLEDDGRGKQKVEVEQLAAWKLLMFSGSFSTRLYVFQDKRRGIVRSLPHVCFCANSGCRMHAMPLFIWLDNEHLISQE